MNTAPHPFSQETIMAYFDGELADVQADAVVAHLATCAECASVAAKLKRTSATLSIWFVENAASNFARSESLDRAINIHQRRISMPLTFIFRYVRPRYVFAAALLVAAGTVWVQRGTPRVILPEQEMRAKLTKDSAPNPRYPEEARKKGVQGVVQLAVVVAKNGSVKSLKLLSGDPLLAKSAQDTVARWKFQPTIVDGKPVEVETTIEITFVLYP